MRHIPYIPISYELHDTAQAVDKEISKLESIATGGLFIIAVPVALVAGTLIGVGYLAHEVFQQGKRGVYSIRRIPAERVIDNSLFPKYVKRD